MPERAPFGPKWEREPKPIEAEQEFESGRGAPTSKETSGCKKCGGTGFMDQGNYKVYCDCRYR